MAGASLLALLDDIATILDDVAVLSKVAMKKTAGVVGDDLALNAQQVTGIAPERELPVVWKVAVGSAINKAILVPAAMLISALLPVLVLPLLMIGGIYLCFEGVEKLLHKFLHSHDEDEHEHQDRVAALSNEEVDIVAFEKDRIRGAVRTDFILSAEIIVISLGVVEKSPFLQRFFVLATIAVFMTVGVYGLVALIVKLDDLGMRMVKSGNAASRGMGTFLLKMAPYLMKGLSIAGTAAMFLVGGGIITHAIPFLHDPIHHMQEAITHAVPVGGGILSAIATMLVDAGIGIVAGAIVVAVVVVVKKLIKKDQPHHA